jgi:hypothetical protein
MYIMDSDSKIYDHDGKTFSLSYWTLPIGALKQKIF